MAAKREKFKKEEIYELYVVKCLSMKKIAQIKNCSESFVKSNLMYYKIPIRKSFDYIHPIIDKNTLVDEYKNKNKPILDIAEKYKVSYTHIRTLLKKYNIPKRLSHRFKKGTDNPRWKGTDIISASLHYDYKHGAERRGIIFDISIHDMEKVYLKQDGCCAISGIKLILPTSKSRTKNSTASLDRIDSNKGYTIDNIQWVHKTINQMKWTIDQKEFVEWCKVVAKHAK